MNGSDIDSGRRNGGDSTGPYDSIYSSFAGGSPRQAMAFVDDMAISPTQELRMILRRRLKALSLVGLGVALVIIGVTTPGHWSVGAWQRLAMYAVCLGLAIVLSGLLWSPLKLSLPILRAGELLALAMGIGVLVWYTLDRNLRGRGDAAFFATLGEQQIGLEIIARSGNGKENWIYNLRESAMEYFTGHYILFWVVVIFAYALFVPNTPRRCTTVIMLLALMSLAVQGSLFTRTPPYGGNRYFFFFITSAPG